MKKQISLGIITLVSLVVIGALTFGIYSTVTGSYALHTRGQGAHQGNQGRGQQLSQNTETSPLEIAGDGGAGTGLQFNDQPRAQAGDWVVLKGTLVELGQELVIETDSGQIVQMGTGPSSYFETLDIDLNVGDLVSTVGFYEDGEFKVKELVNESTGQSITLRDDTGRPMWAGQGQRRNA